MSDAVDAIELPAHLALLDPADVPAEVWRMHKISDGAVYFGQQAAYRFDDPRGAGPASFGVFYAAQHEDGAFVEAALRQGVGRSRPVALAYLHLRRLTRLRLPPALRLVRLYGAGLAANHANSSISASGPGNVPYGLAPDPAANDNYLLSQAYARAVSEHPDRPDGIAYLCKHDNEEWAVALFARAGEVPPALIEVDHTGPLDDEVFLRERWTDKYGVRYV